MFEIGKRVAWTLGGTLTAAAACVLVVAVLVAGGLVISAAMAIAVANRLARRLGLDKRELAEFSGPAEGLSVFVARAAAVCSCAAFAAPCVRGIFIQQQGMADYVPVAVAYIVATLLIARATFWISGVAAAGGSCALLHAFFAAYKQFDRDASGRCRDFWRCGGIGLYC